MSWQLVLGVTMPSPYDSWGTLEQTSENRKRDYKMDG